jgi:release factor glutamine methyltransferase
VTQDSAAAGTDVRSVVAAATARLEAAGVPSPRNDAELLVAHVLGAERSQLITAAPLDPTQQEHLETLVARRETREPLQHLLGVAWFRHVTLQVGKGVYVPRPETELVAGAVIDEANRLIAAGVENPVVVDLCTGSGAIPAAVQDEVPQAHVHAVELSPEAHAFATKNLEGTRVDLRLGDCADAFPDLDGIVDVVVSNPPYVPLGAIIRDDEVAEFDPALALWGGEDGLDVVRLVERTAERLLKRGGMVVVEHGDLQGQSVPEVFGSESWTDVHDNRDLVGRNRYTIGRRA